MSTTKAKIENLLYPYRKAPHDKHRTGSPDDFWTCGAVCAELDRIGRELPPTPEELQEEIWRRVIPRRR